MLRVTAVALVLASALGAAPKLAVERLALHQFEDGPVLNSTYEFLPGETAYFSCRLTGFETEKNEDDRRVKLSWQMEMLDPAGIAIEKPKSGKIETRLLPEDKNWLPKFLESFVIPPFAASGAYRVTVKAKDELSGSELTADLPFHVRGHEVEASPTLVARNFRFLSSEDDTIGVRSAVYHPGQMLWARFDITGYKFGENNQFSVDYGLAIENAEGKQLFAQPEAAGDAKETFYPQRYVAGILSLSLDSNVAPATYTLVVTIRDKTGNQTWEERQSFKVE